MPDTPRARLLIDTSSRPALRPHMKLRHDKIRDRWVVLAPERIYALNAEAAAVLELCDGQRTVSDIAAALAAQYDAPPDAIATDIVPMLQDLADKGAIGR